MALIGKNKVQLDPEVMERVKKHVEEVGFSSVEEFVQYCIEKELAAHQKAGEAALASRLRGLGYIE